MSTKESRAELMGIAGLFTLVVVVALLAGCGTNSSVTDDTIMPSQKAEKVAVPQRPEDSTSSAALIETLTSSDGYLHYSHPHSDMRPIGLGLIRLADAIEYAADVYREVNLPKGAACRKTSGMK